MVTVLMPTYKQSVFIVRAIKSLLAQSFNDWELIIINDGSPDNTSAMVEPFMTDARMRYFENEENKGLGHCLNQGLGHAAFDLIAYLPSDDIYFSDHLRLLVDSLNGDQEAVMAFSDVESEDYLIRGVDPRQLDDENHIQLVQMMHRKTADRWVERAELTTDNYCRLFLNKLEKRGSFITHDRKTCEWINHPHQRTKIINEKFGGGMNKYRVFYNVKEPLRFQSSFGNYVDEYSRYKGLTGRPVRKIGRPGDGDRKLKILLVGELSYNPERVYAFEERGHQLYGLWMREPIFFNTVGPFAFGNIEDIPYEDWEARVEEVQPDIIYALLNQMTVEFAHRVLTKKRHIPFVWHFKEDPFFCIRNGFWKELFELFTLSDGRIFTNQELKDWFGRILPDSDIPSFVLDGDLTSGHWFHGRRSPLLSDTDGEIHTVLPGRPMGFEPEYVVQLAAEKIHLHFYGEVNHGFVKNDIRNLPPWMNRYFHLHSNCEPKDWLEEFSQYDAGWLHLFDSRNDGDIMKANWMDLNYPARLSTYALAGLPTIQKDNSGHLVATQRLAERLDTGIFFNTMEELAGKLRDRPRMQELRDHVWETRELFQFDHYVDDLIRFFQKVIDKKRMY